MGKPIAEDNFLPQLETLQKVFFSNGQTQIVGVYEIQELFCQVTLSWISNQHLNCMCLDME